MLDGAITMPTQNPSIEAVVLIDRSTGECTVRFESPLCSSNSAGELWWEVNSTHHVLYQQEEFYDEALRNRRNTNNMISPRDSRHRLSLVGSVWGIGTHAKDKYIEAARSAILLTDA
jgi:hypothetical protein